MSTVHSENSDEAESDAGVPEYSTQVQRERFRILRELRSELDQLPVRSACASCGHSTDRLLKVSLRNQQYRCVVPLPVCAACAERPPFVLKGVELRWRLASVAMFAAFILAVGQLWLPCLIVAILAVGIAVLVPGPKRISVAARRVQLDEFFRTIPQVHALRTLEPDLLAEVALRDSTVSTHDNLPLQIMDNSFESFESFEFWIRFAELGKSEVHPRLLELLIERIIKVTTQTLQDAELDEETAVQIDFALLPGRRCEFEIQAISKNSASLRKCLIPELKNLPSISVRWPLVFSYRRCKEKGAQNLSRLIHPFLSWRNKLAWTSGATYSELAMQIFEITTPEEFRVLTADDCAAWRKLGELPDSVAVEFVDHLMAKSHRLEAAEVLEEQIMISPENGLLKYRQALILYVLDQVERAAAVSQQLLQQFPGFTEAYGFLAHMQLVMQRPQDAQQTLRSAPEENRSARFWLTYAHVAEALKEDGAALGYVNTAILKDHSYADAFLMRAEILQRQGKPSPALEDIRQAEKHGVMSLQLIRLKVRVLNQLQQPDQAIAALSEALRMSPGHPVLLLMRADALTDAGKLELAGEDCESLLQSDPEFGLALEMKARIYLESDDAASALAVSEQAIANGHDSSRIVYYRGVARMMLEEFERAIEDLECALEKNPDNVFARFHLSRAKAKLNQSESAISDLDQVLTQAEGWAHARVIRGFLHLNQGDLELAAEDFEHALKQVPSLVDAYRGRSIVHRLKGETREALAMLDKALLLDPEDAACRLDRSQLLVSENDLKGATKDLDSVLSSLPELLPALLSRAQLKLQLGKIDDAQKDFEAILKSHPEFTPALIGRSIVLEQKGEHDRSLQDLEAATRNSPENAQAIEISRLLMKAYLAHKNEQFDAAIQAATDVIAIDAENYMAYRYRAGSYWYSDCFVEALQDYSHLIHTQEESDAAAFNGRGQVYAELGEYELALTDLETAVKVARKNKDSGLPYSLSGLGKTLTGLARYDEAEAAFRESLSIQPDNAWLHFNRGLLYLAKEDHRSAGLCFELALRLENPRLSPRKRARAEAFVERINGR